MQQFGPGKMQQHGFARNQEWTLSSTSADLQPDERDPEVRSHLSNREKTAGKLGWCHCA